MKESKKEERKKERKKEEREVGGKVVYPNPNSNPNN